MIVPVPFAAKVTAVPLRSLFRAIDPFTVVLSFNVLLAETAPSTEIKLLLDTSKVPVTVEALRLSAKPVLSIITLPLTVLRVRLLVTVGIVEILLAPLPVVCRLTDLAVIDPNVRVMSPPEAVASNVTVPVAPRLMLLFIAIFPAVMLTALLPEMEPVVVAPTLDVVRDWPPNVVIAIVMVPPVV